MPGCFCHSIAIIFHSIFAAIFQWHVSSKRRPRTFWTNNVDTSLNTHIWSQRQKESYEIMNVTLKFLTSLVMDENSWQFIEHFLPDRFMTRECLSITITRLMSWIQTCLAIFMNRYVSVEYGMTVYGLCAVTKECFLWENDVPAGVSVWQLNR